MTQNLALGSDNGTITLHDYDSDVSSDWVLPQAQTSGNSAWSDWNNTTGSKHVYATNSTDYGNYYNWLTATAGTGTSDMESASATDLTNAESSVCSRGWRLPDGGMSEKASFYQLDKTYGGNGTDRTDTVQRDKFISSPFNFVYSGYYHYGSGRSSYGSNGGGWWWSRSAANLATVGNIFDFRLHSNGYFYLKDANGAGQGFSVRCIAK